MASTRSLLETYFFNAAELRELESWSDPVIDDYLGQTRNLFILADAIDAIEAGEVAIAATSFPYPFHVERKDPDIFVTSIDFEVTGNQRIICTNTAQITVTLNDMPDELEEVDITLASGEIVIDGNGKTINGQTDILVKTQYSSLNIVYVTDIDEWIIS